ncbi:probable insulin-like peptide 7 [Aethina tumida]|uniref:probable insulin-like peptide 7 n=1 Tax=Aethina tumida TaxID=116153 RepID=UPI002147BB33|nr:probable insulin-like peptide 7 [Aethina tumida]
MWFPVSTIAAIFVLFDVSDTMVPDNDLELIFRTRSKSEWQTAWHKEKYSRCRDTLVRHLYWACEKDIYRLTRRTDPFYGSALEDIAEMSDSFPWISPTKAKRYLRFKRDVKRSGPSITSECCKSTGCTWEEYAEYCPTNKRHNSVLNSYL